MLTLLTVRPYSSSKCGEAGLHRVASMPSESLVTLKQESNRDGPQRRAFTLLTYMHVPDAPVGSRVQTVPQDLV